MANMAGTKIEKFDLLYDGINKLRTEEYARFEDILKDYSMLRILKVWIRLDSLFGRKLDFGELVDFIEKMEAEEE
jgi:hypothetical protein